MGLFKALFWAVAVGAVAIFLTLDIFQEHRVTINKLINRYIYDNIVSNTTVELDTPKDTIYNVLSSSDDKLYTKSELAKYGGGPGSLGLYIGILGRVYDVSSGEQHYGPGGGYHFFAGKDGTKAFMTGEFNEKGLIDETTGLSNPQMLELENWITFYDKTYTYKGIVIGNFYSEKGTPTKALLDTIKAIEVAYEDKKQKESERQRFPPCNSQSKKGEYRRVYCTEKSGGVKRDWIGFPRLYYSSTSDKTKCVCVHVNDLNHPHVKLYENCEAKSRSCSLPPL